MLLRVSWVLPSTLHRFESHFRQSLLKLNESGSACCRRRTLSNQSHFRHTMTSLEQTLAELSITPANIVKHAAVSSPATWQAELEKISTVPKPYELIKTLVFKPKTAKSITAVPVVVVARNDTETNSMALGKKLNLKELRLASPDLLAEVFGLDKDSRMLNDSDQR